MSESEASGVKYCIEDPDKREEAGGPSCCFSGRRRHERCSKGAMHIRNEFRDFLRSTLSVLEEDIVENIVRVYDHHCSQEDDVLTATLLVAKDNVEKNTFLLYVLFSPVLTRQV